MEATTLVRRTGEELCRERLLLEPGSRDRPGLLAGVRVVDSVLELARLTRARGTGPQQAAPRSGSSDSARESSTRADVVTYELVDGVSTMTRFLGTSLAESPLTSRTQHA